MGKQSLLKKNVLDIKDNKSWLHNVYVLYFIFIIALGDLYYLMISHSWFYMTLFILIGFLTSFFSKNMVVILCIALTFTNVLKFALTGVKEGFEESDKLTEEAASVTNAPSATATTMPSATTVPSATTIPPGSKVKNTSFTNPPSKQPFTTGTDATATTEPTATTSAVKTTNPATASTTTPSSTTSATSTTAPVQGFTDGVYTTESDMEYKKAYSQKEIITNQEKIMKNLNKYKPLLETINSITKNIAVFKS